MTRLAWRLAARELRGGVRGLRIVLACLALGVAAIAGIGSLRAAIDRGLDENGRAMLGGDLVVEGGSQALPDTLRDWLRARGAAISDVRRLRSLLAAPSGDRQLIDLKAVDGAYPLVGALRLEPPQDLAAALAPRDGIYGLVVDRLVLDRLGARPGDVLRLGEATVRVAAVLAEEPDRPLSPLSGPQAIIAAAALPATGLIQPGSMVDNAIRLTLPPGRAVGATAAAIRHDFPDTGWRVRDAAEAAPGVERLLDQVSLFLTLVGLSALLVGGIGVATGTRSWLEARARTIATLRCLGAPARLVFAVFLIQVMGLSAIGVAIGLAVGAVVPPVGIALLHDVLPVPPRLGLYPGPLGLAAAYGLLTAAAFSLWPLGRAARIPGAALFRDAIEPGRARPPLRLMLANALIGAALVGLTVAVATDRAFAAGFCLAALGTLAVFRLGAAALMRLARRLPRLRRPAMRLGLGNLHRPGSATPLMLVSLGLGLSTLAAVALIEGNIRDQLDERMPADAPSFYFIDIQPDQLARFLGVLHDQPGVREVRQVPSLRARIVSVNGVPADRVVATPDTQWALRGDRGLTYAATPPEGTRIVAGQWWPPDYAGPPLVSFDAGLARGWGVGIGGVIRVNVLGRDIDLTVGSLRDIAWRSLGLNFAMVASPGLLSGAPHTAIATVRSDRVRDGAILRAVTDALPNVTGISVAEILASVSALIGRMGAALSAAAAVTLASGVLVLGGAVAAGQRRRVRDAAVLRAVGATPAQLRAAWLTEFGAIGLAAGVIAATLGTLASWVVTRHVLHVDWHFLPGVLAATVAGCGVLMIGFGLVAAEAALRVRTATLLRND